MLTAAQRLTTRHDTVQAVGGVPTWLIRQNLRQDEADAVITRTNNWTLVHETAKAELIRFDTDFGTVELWAPKSVLIPVQPAAIA